MHTLNYTSSYCSTNIVIFHKFDKDTIINSYLLKLLERRLFFEGFVRRTFCRFAGILFVFFQKFPKYSLQILENITSQLTYFKNITSPHLRNVYTLLNFASYLLILLNDLDYSILKVTYLAKCSWSYYK